MNVNGVDMTSMDFLFLCVVLFMNLVDESSQNRNTDQWDQISIRYGEWYNLPLYQSTAFAEGYHRHNDVCKTDNYRGFLFSKTGNTKAMPIYDLNGNLAGIQSAIPGNMKGFNSSNMTIDLPPEEIMPPLLKGLRDMKGVLYYTVTAYFMHPKHICSPIVPKEVSSGRGLYIQMGFNPENDFFSVPRESQLLPELWKRGHCAPLMGTNYFMNLSQNMPCEKLYPLFLMYNMEGSLGGFGWVFQGRPVNFYSEPGITWFHLTPKPNNLYPFLFDPGMLPPCMFNEKFQVFGLHVYLQDPKRLLCTSVSSFKNAHTTVRIETPSKVQHPRTLISVGKGNERQNKHSENYAIEAFDKQSSVAKIHSLNVLSIFIVISLVHFLYLKYTFH